MLSMPPGVGEEFAGYTILRVLGAGAMGTVYLAQHPRLPRHDALKVLSADLTADQDYRVRFLHEADVAANLSHPNILSVHDRGEYHGQFWISMDFVDGVDAATLLREQYPNGLPTDEALQVISSVASALDYAHRLGLLHRDVKPANILMSEPDAGERRIYLTDFGIARSIDDPAGLTVTNMTMGTVAYAAPEQLRGELVDARADQYALACTAYHLLTGALPYDHPNAAVVITQHVTAPPPSIGERRPELAALDTVFAKAMAKTPADRFGSCKEFAEELRKRLATGPIDILDTQPGPIWTAVTAPAAPPGRKRLVRRPKVLLGVLLGIVVLIGGGILAAVTVHKQHNPTTTPTPAGPPPNTGPFTGTYTAAYDADTDLDGKPTEGSTPYTATWGVRSVCGPTGCVATAARLDSRPTQFPKLVFDNVGGGWVAVALGSDKCRDAPTEVWAVITVQPRPDGTLAGEYSATTANGCAARRTVTFTRTGDVDVNSLPDPAAQAPRVVSPAEGLRGRYRQTMTTAKGTKLSPDDFAVRTACLRTGDRCMSYLHNPESAMQLVFGGGNWIWNREFDDKCEAGDPSHYKAYAQFSLPQPPQDPITLLTGRGHVEATGSCGVSFDIDVRTERLGE